MTNVITLPVHFARNTNTARSGASATIYILPVVHIDRHEIEDETGVEKARRRFRMGLLRRFKPRSAGT